MTGDEPDIVIAGTRGDWAGGARTLTPRDPCPEPDGQELLVRRRSRPRRQPGVVPDHLGRRPPDAAGDARSPRRAPDLDALLAWMKPYGQLGPDINRFQALGGG